MHRGILNTLMNAKQIIRNIPLQLNFHGIDVFIQYSEIDGSLGYNTRLSAAAQEGTQSLLDIEWIALIDDLLC